MNIENIHVENREAIIVGKGGDAERIDRTSTTARLINGRTTGPLFVGERRPRSHLLPSSSDVCEVIGRARLS